MMNTPPSFGAWLKELRTARDLTCRATAERVGCAEQTLRAFESDSRRPSQVMAERIAEVLAVPTDQRAAFLHLARVEASGQMGVSVPPAAPAPPALRPTLPTPPNRLIGRTSELARITTRLTEPDCRLLTLRGPGGMGKTRLALQAAIELAERGAFADGVAWVNLAPVATADTVAAAIAAALDLALRGAQVTDEQLVAALRGRTLLLALDNLEHLTDAAPLLIRILQAAPGVTLLATSRERLRIQGEWVYELAGLPAPRSGARLESAPATQLFLDRARQADHRFAPTPEDAAAATRICQLLEGLPLGIELAAAWVHTLSCAEIAAELERNLDFLATNQRDSEPRHRSLRAVFDHSWRLLTPAEREVLAGMAVFRGGCRRDAVEAVYAAAEQPTAGPPMLTTLAALTDKSLVRRTTEAEGATRYELHEPVRQYALEQLGVDPMAEHAARAAHAAYYLAMVSRNEAAIEGGNFATAWAELGPELDNIRLAWQWAVDQRNITALSQSGRALLAIWGSRSWLTEGAAMFGRAADALRAKYAEGGDDARATAQALGQLLSWLGPLLLFGGQPTAGRDVLCEARALLEEEELLLATSFTLGFLGIALTVTGDYAGGRAILEQNLALARKQNSDYFIGITLDYLGSTAWMQGDYARARTAINEALTIWRIVPFPRGKVMALFSAATLALAEERLDEAEALAQELLQISTDAHDIFGISVAFTSLGRVALLRGDHDQARYLTQEGVDLAYEHQDQYNLGQQLALYGQLAAFAGAAATALPALREAITIGTTRQLPSVTLAAAAGLAALLAQARQDELALRLLTHICTHPACDHETRTRAEACRADLIARSDATQVAAIETAAPADSLATLIAAAEQRLD